DLVLMPPEDLVYAHPERGRQALALLGAGGVPRRGDRLDHPQLEARPLDQRRQPDSSLRHPFGEGLPLCHANPPLPTPAPLPGRRVPGLGLIRDVDRRAAVRGVAGPAVAGVYAMHARRLGIRAGTSAWPRAVACALGAKSPLMNERFGFVRVTCARTRTVVAD